MTNTLIEAVKTVPLTELNQALCGRMVPFTGNSGEDDFENPAEFTHCPFTAARFKCGKA